MLRSIAILKENIPGNIRYMLGVTGLLLLVFFLLRIIFCLYNFSQAMALSPLELVVSFFLGLRFDLSVIFLFNGLLFLFLALPISINSKRKTFFISNILVLAINLPLLIVNGVDIVYYGYAEKRITHEIWTTKQDLVNINLEVLAPFWYLFLVLFAAIFILWKLLQQLSARSLSQAPLCNEMPVKKKYFSFFFGFLIIVLGNQPRMLSTGKAFATENFFAGNLALNSAHTAIEALDIGTPEISTFMSNPEALKIVRGSIKNLFDGPFQHEKFPLVRKAEFEGEENRFNVVFLIIESFNAEFVGAITGDKKNSLTPTMDSLVRHGRLYSNYYANAVRSVEALSSILNSLPEIFLRPTVGSRFEKNNNWGLGNMLKARGYETSFFCGARNGTMGFDNYSRVSGLDNYFGMKEYPNTKRDYDGLWGVHDGPFLLWMLDKQTASRKPFFSVFFSVSNHHPFKIPAKGYEDIENIGGFPLRKTTAYTDRVLGEYFREASKNPWYSNTIFLVTGDHTFHESSDPQRPLIENFHVPLFIMGPGIKPGIDDRASNHINILPTCIELLRLDTWHSSAGVSLVTDIQPSFAIENLMGIGMLAENDFCITINFDYPEQSFQTTRVRNNGKWKNNIRETPNDPQFIKMQNELLAFYQVFNELRVENRIIGKEFMNIETQSGN